MLPDVSMMNMMFGPPEDVPADALKISESSALATLTTSRATHARRDKQARRRLMANSS
jgi:hypothetical protein